MFVIISDSHLKPRIKQKYNIEGDTIRAFKRAVGFAIENNASAIVLAGDTFDPVTSYITSIYQDIISEFPNPVYAIVGQHDHHIPSWFSVKGIVGEDIDQKMIQIEDCTLYGLKNRSKFKIKELLPTVPKVDFLIMHQLFRSVVPEQFWDCDPNWIPDHVRCVISGDYHSAESFSTPGDNTGYYVGNLVPMSKKEIGGVRSFLTIDGGEVNRIEMIPDRKFFRVHIESEEDFDQIDVLDLEHTEFAPFVYLEYNRGLDGIDKIINRLEDLGAVVHCDQILDTNEYEDDGSENIKPEESIKHNIQYISKIDQSSDLVERVIMEPTMRTIDRFKELFIGGSDETN